ncbi:glutamate racemase, partial [filamentous cyanobacterium CCP5]
ILGLIWPGAQAAARHGRRIGLIATAATVKSQAYRQAILEVNAACQVWQVGCPDFVPLIEQNRIHDPQTRTVAERYLEPLRAAQIDTLIYGCTHYPHLAPVLKPLLPPTVNFVNPAVHLVAATARELDALGLRSTAPAWSTQFAVTGSPGQFARTSVQWLGYAPKVSRVNLPVLSYDRPTAARLV